MKKQILLAVQAEKDRNKDKPYEFKAWMTPPETREEARERFDQLAKESKAVLDALSKP